MSCSRVRKRATERSGMLQGWDSEVWRGENRAGIIPPSKNISYGSRPVQVDVAPFIPFG